MVSAILHVSLVVGAIGTYHWSKRLEPVTIQMGELGDPLAEESDKAPGQGVPKPPPPAPEPPKPEPVQEEPKPEPPKPEPPKEEKPKEKPKEEPKPKPELPKEKPKEEKPKDKPKEEKKPAEKKPADKPKQTAKKPADSKAQTAAKTPPKTPPGKPGAPNGLPSQTGPAKPGVRSEGMPSFLDGWCRNLQRKVERVWTIPDGLLLTPENNFAEVEFWIDRAGNLLDTPKVVKAASDPALGESGVQAILLAAPFPPLPAAFDRNSLAIVYVFGMQ